MKMRVSDAEDARLREETRDMARDDFVEWYRQRYDLHYCPRNPSHLIESFNHRMECEASHDHE